MLPWCFLLLQLNWTKTHTISFTFQGNTKATPRGVTWLFPSVTWLTVYSVVCGRPHRWLMYQKIFQWHHVTTTTLSFKYILRFLSFLESEKMGVVLHFFITTKSTYHIWSKFCAICILPQFFPPLHKLTCHILDISELVGLWKAYFLLFVSAVERATEGYEFEIDLPRWA